MSKLRENSSFTNVFVLIKIVNFKIFLGNKMSQVRVLSN
jgi:hypothetical protein